MQKILHLVLGLDVGGLEQFVLTLSRAQLGIVSPSIYCIDGLGELGSRVKDIPVFNTKTSTATILRRALAVVQHVMEYRYDIIHSHNHGPHFYGAIASLMTNVPLVHTKHGNFYPTKFRRILLEKFSCLMTDAIVTVSNEARYSYLQRTCCKTNDVITILNGVDVGSFTCIGRDSTDKGYVNIGIVARLSPEKDHMTLLAAFEIALNSISSLRLIIVGDGQLRQGLESYVDNSVLCGKVFFTGSCLDVPGVLSSFDVFILSSTTEGISISLLEAMAAGLPCIVTDVGGNSEVVIDGETGYIVPPSSPDEMAEKIVALSNNVILRKKLGTSGQKRVLTNFSIESTAKKYCSLYDAIISGR